MHRKALNLSQFLFMRQHALPAKAGKAEIKVSRREIEHGKILLLKSCISIAHFAFSRKRNAVFLLFSSEL